MNGAIYQFNFAWSIRSSQCFVSLGLLWGIPNCRAISLGIDQEKLGLKLRANEHLKEKQAGRRVLYEIICLMELILVNFNFILYEFIT